MSFLPAALMIAGTVTSAVASVKEGNAMAAAEEANAKLADITASQTRQAGAYEETKISREKAQALGTQKARFAKAGVLITEGSPIEVMADTAAQYEKDILVNQYNTEIEARKSGFEGRYRRQLASRYRTLGRTKAVSGVLLQVGKTFIASGYGLQKPKKTTPENG